MEVIIQKNEVEIRKDLQLALSNSQAIKDLQIRLDNAEKNRKPKFEDFNDTDMVVWFLYENKHLRKSDDRVERSTNEYRRELQQFIEALLIHGAKFEIGEIVEGSLFKSLISTNIRKYQDWLATSSPYVLKNGSYAASTLDRKTTVLRSFLRFLHKTKYVSEPLHDGLKIMNTKNEDRPNRDLGPDEVVTLLNTFRDMQHPIMFTIIHVLTTTGMRNEEFCKLKVEDLVPDTIHGGWYLKVLGKGNKKRDIPLKEKAYNSICMFRFARGLPALDEAAPDSSLFTTNTGNPYTPSYLSQYVKGQIESLPKGVMGNSKLTITPHVFRHAFAIISQMNKIEIHSIMRSLGHEKIETTMIYLQKVFEREKHAIHQWDPAKFGEFI